MDEYGNVNERLRVIIDTVGISPTKFAHEIGVKDPLIFRIIGGPKVSPSYMTLRKIALKYPWVNIDWLVMGRGSMRLNNG